MLYERVKEKIISGQYPAGVSLRQDALAKDFGTSRIPVREALFMLEGDGLVEFKPHKGAVVRPLSIKEVSELFRLRALLECDLLRQALPHMTEQDLTRAKEALIAYDKAVASGKNIARWFRLNWLFHEALYQPADTPITLNMVKLLHDNTDRYQRIQMTLSGAQPRAHNEHQELLEACDARQNEKAIALLEKHLLEGGHRVTDFLESSD